jgi:hypothetical protein
MSITTDKIRLILSLSAVFLIPGWSFILITGLWRLWRPLQRWIVAIAASIAFYPLLYYFTRFILPGLHIGLRKNLGLLIIGIILIIFMLRKDWREQFAFDQPELFALVVFGMTIFTRFWIIRDLPYPAWSDSLHHTMLTQLTAEHGALPFTLEPYSGATLNLYHLGLYAITGVVQQLSGAPAYTALLWTAQLFNGLCAIGIYFLLDHFVGRWAALSGIVVAGLLSFQPAWYVNWGRFTQLASQTIMLVAFCVTWQLLDRSEPGNSKTSRWQTIGLILLASGLNAAVFLLHFRVALYYFPLLLGIVILELIISAKKHQVWLSLSRTILVAAISTVLILPALIPAINAYLKPITEGLVEQSDFYFVYTSQTLFNNGIHPVLFWIAVIAGIFALASRHKLLAIITWIWIFALFLEGNLYKLGVPFLNFTNFSGIMIGFYLPAAILIGLGIEALIDRIPKNWQNRSIKTFYYAIFIFGFVAGFYRSSGIEPWRYFVTDYDRQAMDWINQNTPSDAIFAINTYMWLEGIPHGTDGGYWIPFFTGRQTNTETMILPTNQVEEMKLIQDRSLAIVNYIYGKGDLQSLCDNNLDYIYIGKGNVISEPFNPSTIIKDPLAKLVYQNQGVKIFQLCPNKPTQ